MSSYTKQMLGQDASVEVAYPETYSSQEMKNVQAYTEVVSERRKGIDWYKRKEYGPGTSGYYKRPFSWVDLPRNYIENKGSIELFRKRGDMRYGVRWKGRAFSFKNPQVYINKLEVIEKPDEYIRYLKLAPLAGFNIVGQGTKQTNCASRGYKGSDRGYDKPYKGDYCPSLPPEATEDWWKECITYHILKRSFLHLRMGQIEDLPDLEASYANAGKLIDKLRGEMRNEVPVDVLPRGPRSTGFRITLRLAQWEIEKLEKGIRDVYRVYHNSRQQMARRIIQLQDADTALDPTTFSVDPLQNPYLVYNVERSQEAGRPIFTNIARNKTANWSPPEVAGRPENLKYWEQVPDYEAEHARVYMTEHGPASEADINKYGLDGKKRTNWLPWIVAGGAAAFAATQVL